MVVLSQKVGQSIRRIAGTATGVCAAYLTTVRMPRLRQLAALSAAFWGVCGGARRSAA